MRIPPDNGADSQLTRRRDRMPAPEHAPDQRLAPASPDGYDDPSAGAHGPASWYGSTADGAAGKGPVRGYPPVPGQPPPMYPPGQFAAWNRGQGGRPAPRLSAPDSGRHQAQPGWQTARPTATRPASGSGYYGREAAGETDPDYSMLAVSDPAADVTSTQTWKAVDDGRATGVWTMPDRTGAGSDQPGAGSDQPGAGSDRPGAARHRAGPGPDRPAAMLARPAAPAGPAAVPSGLAAAPSGLGAALAGRASRPGSPLTSPDAPRGPGTPPAADGPPGPVTPHLRSAAGRTAAGTSPSRPGSQTGPGRAAGRGHSGAHTGPHPVQRTKRKRPASVKVAISGALLLVLAAAAALSYEALHGSTPKSRPQTPVASKPTVIPSPSPTLGPYGDIGTRKSDPTPLTVAQLYPASYSSAGATVVLTASKLGSDCGADVSGAAIQSVVGAAGCSQVARATYLSASQHLMGTIGVFNLSTASGAKKAVQSADAQDFVSQLAAKHGETSKIGQGTGIEEAAAKGHYLILIWAEFTSLRKPRTASQRTEIENFMTELLDNTANVSLANRMLTGSP